MSTIKQRFEEWFLSLNSDFGDEELTYSDSRHRYFYTTTQAMYTQFCELDTFKDPNNWTHTVDVDGNPVTCFNVTLTFNEGLYHEVKK